MFDIIREEIERLTKERDTLKTELVLAQQHAKILAKAHTYYPEQKEPRPHWRDVNNALLYVKDLT